MKRKLLLLVVMPVLQVCLYTACGCDELPYFDIVDMDVHPVNSSGEIVYSLPSNDTLCLKVENKVNFMAVNRYPSGRSLIPAAYAKCAPDGNDGIKHAIEQIEVYSMDGYFTPNATMEKVTHIALFQPAYDYGPAKYEVKEFIDFTTNTHRDYYRSLQRGMYIYITRPSLINHRHRFIIEIKKSDGSIIRAETPVITWQ